MRLLFQFQILTDAACLLLRSHRSLPRSLSHMLQISLCWQALRLLPFSLCRNRQPGKCIFPHDSLHLIKRNTDMRSQTLFRWFPLREHTSVHPGDFQAASSAPSYFPVPEQFLFSVLRLWYRRDFLYNPFVCFLLPHVLKIYYCFINFRSNNFVHYNPHVYFFQGRGDY